MRLLKWGPWQGGCSRGFPETPLWFCQHRIADKVCIRKPDPEGLEWGLLPGAAWGEGARSWGGAICGWGAGAPQPSLDGLPPTLHMTNGKTEMQRPKGHDQGPTARSSGGDRAPFFF